MPGPLRRFLRTPLLPGGARLARQRLVGPAAAIPLSLRETA